MFRDVLKKAYHSRVPFLCSGVMILSLKDRKKIVLRGYLYHESRVLPRNYIEGRVFRLVLDHLFSPGITSILRQFLIYVVGNFFWKYSPFCLNSDQICVRRFRFLNLLKVSRLISVFDVSVSTVLSLFILLCF